MSRKTRQLGTGNNLAVKLNVAANGPDPLLKGNLSFFSGHGLIISPLVLPVRVTVVSVVSGHA
jgi:hypothetical protein